MPNSMTRKSRVKCGPLISGYFRRIRSLSCATTLSLSLILLVNLLICYVPAFAQISQLRDNIGLVKSSSTSADTGVSEPIQSRHTISSAGIGFQVPAGWKVARISDGSVVVYTSKGAVMMTFMMSDQPQETVEGLIFGFKNRLTEVTPITTHEYERNRIQITNRAGKGKLDGRLLYFGIEVLKLQKPVVVYTTVLDGTSKGRELQSIRESMTRL